MLSASYIVPALAISLVLSTPPALQSQPATLELEPLAELSNVAVTRVIQDRSGFLWFGTRNGLYHYDGYDLTLYQSDPSSSTSLSNNWIEALHSGADGVLWVGTRNGLNSFDPITLTFQRHSEVPTAADGISNSYITALCCEATDTLWIGTYDGLDARDASGALTRFRHRDNNHQSLSSNQISALHRDEAGYIWVGTYDAGLNRLDPASGDVLRYQHDPLDPASLSHDAVRDIHEDAEGVLWIGTYGGGLNAFDPRTNQFTRFRHDADDEHTISSDQVLSIVEDDGGVLWIGTWGGGLNAFDRAARHFIRFPADPTDRNGLSHPIVPALHVDDSDVLWVGTLDGASKRVPPQGSYARHRHDASDPSSISSDHVSAIAEDATGQLWIGTYGGGLNRFDVETGRFTRYQHQPEDPHSLPHDAVWDVKVDSKGELWIGTERGLAKFEQETQRFRPYVIDSSRSRQPHISYIFLDSDGWLWLGTYGDGLYRFEPESGAGKQYLPDLSNNRSLSDSTVLAIQAVGRDGLWIATLNGLNYLDRRSEEFVSYRQNPGNPQSLSHNLVFSIRGRKDSDTLWVGTWNGLNAFDTGHRTFTHLADRPEMRAPVYEVLDDTSGTLWLRVANGVVRYHPSSGAMWLYETALRLPGNDLRPVPLFRSSDGILYIGDKNGLTVFRPPKKSRDVPIALSSMHINNQPAIEEYRAFRQRANGSLVLEPGRNTLDFRVAALDFRAPDKNQYAFYLQGFDEGWLFSGTERSVSYRNLPPGRYLLRVKSAASDGIWSSDIQEAGFSLPIVIERPVWAHWWFWTLLGAGLLGLGFASHVIRVRSIRARNRMLESEVAERTADLRQALQHLTEAQDQLVHEQKMASLGRLAAGIAHEIKNPLNFVNNFASLSVELSEELREELDQHADQTIAQIREELDGILTDLKENAARITHHGKRADGIVQSMMAHAGNASSDRNSTDLNVLLEEYVDLAYHGMRAQEVSIDVAVQTSFDSSIEPVMLVPQEIGRVLINLLQNAYDSVLEKARAEGNGYVPKITVISRQLPDAVEIRVRDNGAGIPEDTKSKIFEPFFTTKAPGSGTGLGLSISYNIVVEGHGGKLLVETEPGEYAEFIVRLPVSVSKSTLPSS